MISCKTQACLMMSCEVQKRRVLWDTTDEEYKDRNRKNTAWIEVAEAVCSEDFKTNQEAEQIVFVQNVSAKWKSIRELHTEFKKTNGVYKVKCREKESTTLYLRRTASVLGEKS
ncbi:hypothetical protein JTB14_015588 [Gonioctena quinquepunctata]|nr:hypothetical protein JTB14_015588 [Gonioctena quinquepunctata]